MGASPTIEEQSKKDQAFQKYIDERNADLDKTVSSARTTMDDQIKKFYTEGGWSDAKPLASGSYQHLATASTWSLDHVNAMIDAVRSSVFGGPPAPKPDPNVPNPKSATGNQTTAPDEKTKSLMEMMGGTELIIANAAFSVITGILTQFKSSTETELGKTIKQKDLLPGLSLFVCVMENKYHRSDFLSDELIVQNFYLYDCRMSVSRAADIAKFDRIQSLIKQQLDLEAGADDASGEIKKLKLSDYRKDRTIAEASKLYRADLADLSSIVNDFNTKIEATGKLIESLRAVRLRANAAVLATKHRELLAMS